MPDAAENLDVSGLRVVRGARAVVDGVSFRATCGRVLGILGPNGAGKSSLLKAVVGILPHEGELTLGGVSLRTMEPSARARRMAYVPQQSELRAALVVGEVVAQGRYPHRVGFIRPTSRDREEITAALALVDAGALEDRPFTSLSVGERQRVLIARALATGARVLLLDEPTSSLDVGHALRLYALLRDLAGRGYCIVAALHPLERALEWADDVLLLERGHPLAFGEAAEVIRPGRIEEVYGVRLVPNGALGFRLPDSATEGEAP